MPLPKFKHYSYRDAADELKISLDKLKYLLDQGYLRHAISMSSSNNRHYKISSLEGLSGFGQYLQAIDSNDIGKAGWLSNELDSEVSKLTQHYPDDYLYLNHSDIDSFTFNLDPEDERHEYFYAVALEDLKGGKHLILDRSGLSEINFGKLIDDWFFTNGVISGEEIDSLLDKESVELERKDSAGVFIERYFNSYLSDHGGEIPSVEQFIAYAESRYNEKTESFDSNPDDITEEEEKGNEPKDLDGSVRISGLLLTRKNLGGRLYRFKNKLTSKQRSVLKK